MSEKFVEDWNRRATQPTSGEPVAPIGYISKQAIKDLANGSICTVAPDKMVDHGRAWAVPVYDTPLAAAHGDDAVQYRLLRVGEIIQATDELLRDDCATWTPMSEGRQLGIGWGWHAGLMPVRRIDAAMRAQGDGEVQ